MAKSTMEITAKAKFIRMSPRKVRLVIDMIRGKKAGDALDILNFSTRWAKEPALRVLKSAIANAEHNFKLQKDNLYIKTIKADGGPMMKRWSPRAFGRAAPVRKRTSHITIVLDEIKDATLKRQTVSNKNTDEGKLKIKNEKLKVKARRSATVKKNI